MRQQIISGLPTKLIIYTNFYLKFALRQQVRSHGVMVSTLDFESSDPSSNLGGTYIFFLIPFFFLFEETEIKLM